MAGGKGKSSGGKSSGGKVGIDGGKKQQSHSSKAGLQVSDAQLYYLPFRRSVGGLGIQELPMLVLDVVVSPRQVASLRVNNIPYDRLVAFTRRIRSRITTKT